MVGQAPRCSDRKVGFFVKTRGNGSIDIENRCVIESWNEKESFGREFLFLFFLFSN